MPRLRGENGHLIQYRHIIDWLVKKPGAFENYRYRDALFPTHRFRMAYDHLREQNATERSATKAYLAILQLSAHTSEGAVDRALERLLCARRVAECGGCERGDRLAKMPVTTVCAVMQSSSRSISPSMTGCSPCQLERRWPAYDDSPGCCSGARKTRSQADSGTISKNCTCRPYGRSMTRPPAWPSVST